MYDVQESVSDVEKSSYVPTYVMIKIIVIPGVFIIICVYAHVNTPNGRYDMVGNIPRHIYNVTTKNDLKEWEKKKK